MIDPITGLPQDVPDRVVNQIVLGQQTFPWRDLKATERPKRPSIYGDDLIPTASLVTGQDDTGENRAARMTADRRLMVDTGSSGGGGIINSGLPVVQQAQRAELHGSGAGRRIAFIQANMLIISIVITVSWNAGYPQPYPTTELGTIGIKDVTTATFVPLAQFRSNSPAATGTPTSTDKVVTMIYPGGLNMHPALPVDPGDTYFLELQNATEACLYNVVLMLGSSV